MAFGSLPTSAELAHADGVVANPADLPCGTDDFRVRGAEPHIAVDSRLPRGTASYDLQLQQKLGFLASSFGALASGKSSSCAPLDNDSSCSRKALRTPLLDARLLLPPPVGLLDIVQSPVRHFRMRARCGVVMPDSVATLGDHPRTCEKEADSSKGLFRLFWETGEDRFKVIDNFGLDTLAEPICAMVPLLAELLSEERFASLRTSQCWQRKLCEVQFHATLQQSPRQLLFCLIYAGSFDETEAIRDGLLAELRDRVETALASSFSPIQVIAVSKGRGWQRCVPPFHEFVDEVLLVSGQSLRYRQPYGHFSNPNAHVGAATSAWLRSGIAELLGSHDRCHFDLLELYCGCGSHTIALAPLFRRVLAVELNQHLVEAARHNVAANDIDNVAVMHAPSARFCQGLLEDRCAELVGEGLPERLEFGCVVVDPPRAGLDDLTIIAVAAYEYVLYISCSPSAMRRDMAVLLRTHDVIKFALLDHFPYTVHIETAAIFSRRQGAEGDDCR